MKLLSLAYDQAMSVALWTVKYGAPDYYLFESEAEAAGYAAYLTEWVEEGRNPLGIQFADSRALPLKSWPAFADEQERREAERKAKAALPPEPQPPMRTVRDPFGGQALEIEADEPAWLGVAP
jgi:hypothetical protein